MPKYYSTSEAAQVAGYSDDSSIRYAIRRGSLAAIRLGRYWYITPKALQSWLDNGKHYHLKNS